MAAALTPEGLRLPPRPQGRLRVPLTPLADTMFQLLIFFMLASNLTAYSTLPLQGGPAVTGQAGGAATGGSGEAVSQGTTLWTVLSDGLRVGGQTFTMDDIPDLAAALPEGGRIVLILRDETRVDDVATVLERLIGSGVASVRIATLER